MELATQYIVSATWAFFPGTLLSNTLIPESFPDFILSHKVSSHLPSLLLSSWWVYCLFSTLVEKWSLSNKKTNIKRGIKGRVCEWQILTGKDINMLLGHTHDKIPCQGNLRGKVYSGLQGTQSFLVSNAWQRVHGAGPSHCIYRWETEKNIGGVYW